MPRVGKRVRLATGIYRDGQGFAVSAMVRGQRLERRLPPSVTMTVLRGARQRLIAALEDATPQPERGSLGDDVRRYLERLPPGSYANDRAQLLAPWVAAHGSAYFPLLSRAQIMATLMAWERDGLSATTRNHRLSALRVLWRTIAPDEAQTHACERVLRAPAPKAQRNRARPLALIALVLDHVTPTTNKRGGDDSHAKAQLELLAWTGQPSATLARIRPSHVRWETKPVQVYLQPRRKGVGAHGQWVDLLPQGAAALKAWLALGVTTAWHRGSIRLAWQRAVQKAQKALRAAHRHDEADLLTGMRVYDLRHSFLTAMAMATKDVYAVSEYAQHSDIRTTLTYMSGASSSRVRAAITTFAKAVPVRRHASGRAVKSCRK